MLITKTRDLHKLPRWPGECCAIIASGHSAREADIAALRDRMHVAVVNNSWQLAPWADLLYACDFLWWQRPNWRAFKGLKVTQDVLVEAAFPNDGIVRIEVTGSDAFKREPFGSVGSGSNGAYQLLNLLVQMGCTGVALVGVDCGGEHWHGRHLPPLGNPTIETFETWRKSFELAAPELADLGVDVVNCSPISAVRAFPKMSVREALDRWGL